MDQTFTLVMVLVSATFPIKSAASADAEAIWSCPRASTEVVSSHPSSGTPSIWATSSNCDHQQNSSSSSMSATPSVSIIARERGLEKLRETLKKHGYATVNADTMKSWLQSDIGPEPTINSAMPAFHHIWEESTRSQMSTTFEPIKEHIKMSHAKYNLSVYAKASGRNWQPQKNTEYSITDKVGDRWEKFVFDIHKATSSKGNGSTHHIRNFPAAPLKWDKDEVFNAVQRFFAELFAAENQRRMNIQAPAGDNLYVVATRTIINKFGGDPGLEGVHMDGAVAGMIMVVNRENIRAGSGGTRIWSTEQKTGKPTLQDVGSDKLLYTWQPSSPFDALFFLDERVLHEALQGKLVDQSRGAFRDMLIYNLRRKDNTWFGENF